MAISEASDREGIFAAHRFVERLVDLGDVRMNYTVTGDPDAPALLLVPAQSESWWGYEAAMLALQAHFRVYAVDLRGQGRSTWTPGRYTLDIMGGDLVRFIDLVIGRPAIAAGNSSGGILAAWLAAYAKPGQIRGVVMEDAPVFSSEVSPAFGQPIRQTLGPMYKLRNTWLGDQWSIGDWRGLQRALASQMPSWMSMALEGMGLPAPDPLSEPPQNMKEYDPEWARAFTSGYATLGCDQQNMLSSTRVPVLFTHHFRAMHEASGVVVGAASDQQVRQARHLIEDAGQPFSYISLPTMVHAMHRHDPDLYARTLLDWSNSLTRHTTQASKDLLT